MISKAPYQYSEEAILSTLAALSTMRFLDAASAIRTYLAVACDITGTQTALIGDLDSTHQYIRAIYPATTGNLAAGSVLLREDTFCQYIDMTAQPLVVSDSRQDVRVQGLLERLETPVIAYLGVPIPASTQHFMPTLCTFDPQAHNFSELQVAALKLLAHQIALWMPYLRPHNTQNQAVELNDATLAVLNRIVAHDIRNPLHFLQATLELLQTDPAWNPDQTLGSLLPQAQGSVVHIQRLIRDLVDGTALMTGTLSLIRHTIDLAGLIEEIVAVNQIALKPRCTLHVALAPNLPAMVSDRDRVWQIVHNLVSNAIRYTNLGTITIEAMLTDDQNNIRIQVHDTGIGIKPEDLERIWELHTRASLVSQGWGLGLYIVRSLTQALGGTVGVSSTLGKGSSFWVILPLIQPIP